MRKLFILVTSSLVFLTLSFAAMAQKPKVTLYKDPNCGCCVAYADYLAQQGFPVRSIDRNDMDNVKRRLGTAKAASCHTLVIDQYVVEGHVPVEAINKMLAEQPAIHGLAIPGMPLNSPGMGPKKAGSLKVLSLDKQGKVTGLYIHL